MHDEPRFQTERFLDADRTEAGEIARALDDPYTIIEDRRSGDCFIVYDTERAPDLGTMGDGDA